MITIVVPLTLLFTFVYLRVVKVSTGLLSVKTVSFKVVVSKTMIVIRKVFITLSQGTGRIKVPMFGEVSGVNLVQDATGRGTGTIFFSGLVVVATLVPVFSFRGMRKGVFSPLTCALKFTLLKTLVFALALIPIVSSVLLGGGIHREDGFLIRFVERGDTTLFTVFRTRHGLSVKLTSLTKKINLFLCSFLKVRFLPRLGRKTVCVHTALPRDVSLSRSMSLTGEVHERLLTFPRMERILSRAKHPGSKASTANFCGIRFRISVFPRGR